MASSGAVMKNSEAQKTMEKSVPQQDHAICKQSGIVISRSTAVTMAGAVVGTLVGGPVGSLVGTVVGGGIGIASKIFEKK